MKLNQEFDRMMRQEFPETVKNLIFRDDDGVYHVFDKYQIIPTRQGFQVYCAANQVGVFSSSKTAISWCIADKYQNFTLATELLDLDQKLFNVSNDIAVRAAIADRSTKWEFRDPIGIKLETKLIRKKQLENRLTKCVNWAKYYQQRGFNNETARTGRSTPFKSSR